ncbi:8-amino-7-oxononanoate synthase [Pokkaliibacter sp. CJK22405]|uniref:8-amino-7-oxononanoate synthase n=1 Tax=Pokkaliibacter sp. CJK22405 TaxID=3384615 RepID=UPI0039855E56
MMRQADPFDLQERLLKQQAQHRYRQRQTLESPQQAHVQLQGKTLLNFCSNDYLGLANHPKLIESAGAALRRFGTGSGASHLVCGHSSAHHALEEALAEFTGRERALLFSTGYMANTGVLGALLSNESQVLEDRLNHASLLDGGLHSGARFKRYRHNDVDDLARLLGKQPELPSLVVTDGVFSMDGDCAPLAELASVCADYPAWLMVDDAHGFGVLGKTGAGLIEAQNLSPAQVPVMMATLGKALGCAGAFVAGSETLIEALIQFARPYIYTTAMPPAMAAAALTALSLLSEESWRRDQVLSNVRYFRQLAQEAGLPLMLSETPIQPLLIGDEALAMQMATNLREAGFWITAIRPPTVPAGTSRLRVTLTAEHQSHEIERLVSQLSIEWQRLAQEATL